jgi:hypothetical protein
MLSASGLIAAARASAAAAAGDTFLIPAVAARLCQAGVLD